MFEQEVEDEDDERSDFKKIFLLKNISSKEEEEEDERPLIEDFKKIFT